MEAASPPLCSLWVWAVEGFCWFSLGAWGDALCFHSGLMGGDSSGNPHGPLCAPVRSPAAGAPCCSQPPGQQQVSRPHCHHPYDPLTLSLCPIAITPWPQEPLRTGWQTACGTELFLCNARWSLPILHVSSIGAEVDQINGQCPNGGQ